MILSSPRRCGCRRKSAMPCSPFCAPIASIRSSRRAARAPRLGVITTGKSYLDVRQALDELGIDELRANEYGLRLYKIACPWPLEPQGLREFAQGLEKIIVVEEKRSLIEVQLREELYGSKDQPICIGKKDEKGQWLFPVTGALDPNDIAIAIGRTASRLCPAATRSQQRVEQLERAQRILVETQGCRRSARPISVPAARIIFRPKCRRACAPMPASAAITWSRGWIARPRAIPRWVARARIGSAKRLSRRAAHIIQNLGDGTYNHSGILALRWAVGCRRQHHLQDSVQRCRGDDRRPEP